VKNSASTVCTFGKQLDGQGKLHNAATIITNELHSLKEGVDTCENSIDRVVRL